MDRYVDQSLLVARLRAGRSLEQWLGTRIVESEVVIHWLQLNREPDGQYSITRFEVYDEGNEELHDVHEFSPVGVDEPYGATTLFESPEETLAAAQDRFGAKPDRFVSKGIVQDEYADYVLRRKVSPGT